MGIACYVFGLRHGVDADHIAAIDNTTRKLMQENQNPFTVGLWFSLGYSTIVVALIVALVLAALAVAGRIPALQSGGAVIGSTVSGVFLWLIGIVNVVILLSIYRIFKEMRHGAVDQEKLESLLQDRGFMNRYFRPLFKIVTKPWQFYPIGVLFGLGFDTATEVALIAISVGIGVSSSVPDGSGAAVHVHVRYGVSGHDGRSYDAYGLWLGFSESDSEDILQPDCDGDLNTRCSGYWNGRASTSNSSGALTYGPRVAVAGQPRFRNASL